MACVENGGRFGASTAVISASTSESVSVHAKVSLVLYDKGKNRGEKGHSIHFVLLTDHLANPKSHPTLLTHTEWGLPHGRREKRMLSLQNMSGVCLCFQSFTQHLSVHVFMRHYRVHTNYTIFYL